MIKLPSQITTERLIIRPFHDGDRTAYLDFMTEERATRYLVFTPEQKTEAGALQLFDFITDSYASDDPIFAYAIALPDDRFIGSLGISQLPGISHLPPDGVYECYYSLLPRYWKQGYATEATRALFDYCFEHDAVREIRAYMSPDNPDSAGVAERAGMRYQGLQTHPVFGNQGLLYTLTRY